MARLRFERKHLPLHLMVLPAVVLVIVYHYLPLTGVLIAFENFRPNRGFLSFFTSPWVGAKHFQYLFGLPDFRQVVLNTVVIASMKMVANIVVPVIVALLLNEMEHEGVKKVIQTTIYLPHFISWVILGGVFVDLLSPSTGIINRILGLFGAQPIFFLADNGWFRYAMVGIDVWKNFGFGTVVYLAAITGIDPTLYEAAMADGAGYLRRAWHITIPGMLPIVVLVTILNLSSLLNAGFDQIFNMYNPVVYKTGDIIDTFVYRIGIVDARYSLATAVGLFKSAISAVLVSTSYYVSYRFANYRIF
jgi:putative aldouronate transport system permease protein